jgi:hypothetical protein
MKPPWGNPASLKIRSISMKRDNLFVVEFSFKQDMERERELSMALHG